MLNRAARYFPILREIRRKIRINESVRVLEVGSGSIGLGEFYPHRFVGCDVSFSEAPRAPMVGVRCSGSQLPFADASFDVVVVSDVMEHIPPDWRQRVLQETLRVARRLAVIGYPCGTAAFNADMKLREAYLRRNAQPPVWLDEHMLYPFPDQQLFSQLPRGWSFAELPNESLTFHYRMMRVEMYRSLDQLFRIALVIFPRMIERLLRRADRTPSYRKIFVLSRQ